MYRLGFYTVPQITKMPEIGLGAVRVRYVGLAYFRSNTSYSL